MSMSAFRSGMLLELKMLRQKLEMSQARRECNSRERLVQILNEARCLSKRTVWNGDLADRILAEFDLVTKPRMDCGCLEGTHTLRDGQTP